MTRKAEHARAALRHADAGIQRMRALVRRDGEAREVRICAEAVLRELLSRQQRLVELHNEIESASAGEIDELWEEFFDGYDDFLEALEAARRESAERDQARATGSVSPPRRVGSFGHRAAGGPY